MFPNPATATRLARLSLLAMTPLLAGMASAQPPEAAEVCVIAPRSEADPSGRALARVPLSQPTIFVREPLARVRLLRGSTVLWERQSGPGGAIEGPIAWPLPPWPPGTTSGCCSNPSAAGPPPSPRSACTPPMAPRCAARTASCEPCGWTPAPGGARWSKP
jgi:hypothetical protein